ncbi:MAG: hypothetical protein J6Y91_04155 [Alphaproteobacteria bacterium]|nr:hypothetical protein [Alphaproteobacteria bacterium]
MKINEKGRSMIEMLGVLAVIGVLSVGGYDLVSKANNNRKATAVIDEIGTLAAKSRTIMRDYDASTATGNLVDATSYVHDGRGYPDSMEYSSGKFIGTDEVEYKVYYSKSDQVLFMLEVSNLSNDMCIQIATIGWGSRSTNGFLGMDVDVSTIETLHNTLTNTDATISNNTGIPGNTSHPVPMGVGRATDLCKDDVTMHFAFR